MLRTPCHFVGKFSVLGRAVAFVETRELGQGGPAIGYLQIGGAWVLNETGQRAESGGPLLVQGPYLLAPLLQGFDFRLARLNVRTGRIVAKSAVREKLLLPASAEGNTIYYYNDLDNSQLKSCTLEVI
ncbi:MAG: hypothetical protein EOO56_01585 [Hymenobacter sp.]|nr:MAG: hypothetical protein EOO56_01585 [Hymenobacter sp.]